VSGDLSPSSAFPFPNESKPFVVAFNHSEASISEIVLFFYTIVVYIK